MNIARHPIKCLWVCRAGSLAVCFCLFPCGCMDGWNSFKNVFTWMLQSTVNSLKVIFHLNENIKTDKNKLVLVSHRFWYDWNLVKLFSKQQYVETLWKTCKPIVYSKCNLHLQTWWILKYHSCTIGLTEITETWANCWNNYNKIL